jgi:hypothetical protein
MNFLLNAINLIRRTALVALVKRASQKNLAILKALKIELNGIIAIRSKILLVKKLFLSFDINSLTI